MTAILDTVTVTMTRSLEAITVSQTLFTTTVGNLWFIDSAGARRFLGGALPLPDGSVAVGDRRAVSGVYPEDMT